MSILLINPDWKYTRLKRKKKIRITDLDSSSYTGILLPSLDEAWKHDRFGLASGISAYLHPELHSW